MVYVKSMLAGLIALIVIPVCLLVILMTAMLIYFSLDHPMPGEGSIGWDPISLYRQKYLFVWFIPVVIFLAGFFWEYRRLAK